MASAAHTVPAPSSSARHRCAASAEWHHHRRCPGDAGPVEQSVGQPGLVLQRHPLRPAVGDERTTDQRRRDSLRNAAEHHAPSGRGRTLDGRDDGAGGSASLPTPAQPHHRRGTVGDVDDDDRRVRLRTGARPLRRHDEHLRGAELAERGDERRPARRRTAGEDHSPSADELPSGSRHHESMPDGRRRRVRFSVELLPLSRT